MEPIKKNELKQLLGPKKGWCVSLYMPVERAGRKRRQNPIRLKNLLREAQRQLEQAGIPADRAERLLAPGRDLLDDKDFWRAPKDGLAVFLAQGRIQVYRSLERFDELVVIARRFHLKPLLPVLSGGGHYFVLVLSQKRVRFLRGTRGTLSEIELPGLPKSKGEALRYDEPRKQLQFHTGTPRGRAQRDAVFHGQGAGADAKKTDLLRFFRRIDRELHKVLAGEDAPLVLASVDYYRPLFEEASGYPHLARSVISGNPDELDEDGLRRKAWKIAGPLLARRRAEAIASYKAHKARGRASTALSEVVPAAHHGRVATLFVAVGVQRWGLYDPKTDRVSVAVKADASNLDLLDLAAAETYLTGGTVYALPRKAMPVDAPIAAVFRY